MNIRYWHFLLIALATATGARAQGTGLDEGPSIVIREAAYYPLGMQKAAMEDSVNVWVVIAPSGAVESVKVLGRPFPGFKGAAMLAAWRSQYEPAMRDGVATRDSLLLEYQFRLDRNTAGVIKSDSAASAQEVLDLASNQACLYGHWISGRIVVRRTENRVYVDGFRVYPGFYDIDDPDVVRTPAMARTLRRECTLLERELALQGLDRSLIRQRTLKMLTDFDRIASAMAVTNDSLAVRMIDGTSAGFTLGDPYDAESYWAQQSGKAADPVDQYYAWLERLHGGVWRNFVIFQTGHEMRMSVQHATATALRSHLEVLGSSRNEKGGVDLPDDLCNLVSAMCDMIRKPFPVQRL